MDHYYLHTCLSQGLQLISNMHTTLHLTFIPGSRNIRKAILGEGQKQDDFYL